MFAVSISDEYCFDIAAAFVMKCFEVICSLNKRLLILFISLHRSHHMSAGLLSGSNGQLAGLLPGIEW